MLAAGPAEQDSMAPEKRQGSLWDAYRSLHKAGFSVDARDYSTAFRVRGFPEGTDLSVLQVCYSLYATTPTSHSFIPGRIIAPLNRVHS